tara:strand:+ start:628 stop:990 length:363 start_codon:yes stop_codon:yes gene_type:complete
MLGEFFAAGRETAPLPSADLLNRIAADAEVVDGARAASVAARPPRRGVFAAMTDAIGGWPALAGMATAAVAGVWIGVAQPVALTSLTGGVLGAATTGTYELEDLMPGYSTLSTFNAEVAQ